MIPQSPVPGPSDEDGFVLPLFGTPGPQNANPEIQLVEEEENISPQCGATAADDNQCACQ